MTFRILLNELGHYLFRRLPGLIFYGITKARTVKIDGIRLYVADFFSLHMRKEFYKGKYERPERKILEKTLTQADTVLEVGAGVGYLGIVSRKIVAPNKRVFLVEANPKLLPIIKKNAEMNNVSLEAQNCILGQQEGTEKFYLMENFWSSSTQPKAQAIETIDIPVKSFQELLDRLQPTYLVIDIEGGEASLLNGQELKSVHCICMEVHPHYVGDEKIASLLIHLFNIGFFIDFHVSEGNVLFLSRRSHKPPN